MAVKQGTKGVEAGDTAWEGKDGNGAENVGHHENVVIGGMARAGMAELWAMSSLTSNNRELKIVQDALTELDDLYKRMENSTTSDRQRATIPARANISPNISAILPGIVLYREIGNTLYLMGALFSTKELTISSEYIRMPAPAAGGPQSVSVPLTPVGYVNATVMKNLEEHYTAYALTKNIKIVQIINMLVVDIEMMKHEEAGDEKDRGRLVANYLAASWEEAILVKIPQDYVAAKKKLDSPFIDKLHPYGKDDHAEARVNAISGRLTNARTISAANMEIIASTMNNINNPQSFTGLNSKEIARVTANVSLQAQSYQGYLANLAANPARSQQNALERMMNIGQGIYPEGFRPLYPVITMEEAQAGEMLGHNQGLVPYLYGMYLLMSANNNYVFAESLRKVSVGARGNLSALETRIDDALAGLNVINGRIKLDDKSILDTDAVNAWIRQNVAPRAVFQSNISPCGPHAAINNFLLKLAQPLPLRNQFVNTVIAVLDAISNGAFSKQLASNIETKTGWNIGMPVLHPTATISTNGLAHFNGKSFNTQEVDEMLLCTYKGKQGSKQIQAFLNNQYGISQESFPARCQKQRVELSSSLFDGAVHINNFSQAHIWDPLFMQSVGLALDTLGSMNTANNLGSFRTNQQIFALNGGLATLTATGSNGNTGPGIASSYNMGVAFG